MYSHFQITEGICPIHISSGVTYDKRIFNSLGKEHFNSPEKDSVASDWENAMPKKKQQADALNETKAEAKGEQKTNAKKRKGAGFRIHKNLEAKRVETDSDQPTTPNQKRKWKLSVGLTASLLTAVSSVFVGWLVYSVGEAQQAASLETEQIQEFHTAYDDATDSTKGEAHIAGGVYALADYWASRPDPDLPTASIDARKRIVASSQDRIAGALTAVLVSDSATWFERDQAAWAIAKAFPARSPNQSEDMTPQEGEITILLFGDAQLSTGDSYVTSYESTGTQLYPWGSVTFADEELNKIWLNYKKQHPKARYTDFDKNYQYKMYAMENVFAFCDQYYLHPMFRACWLERVGFDNAKLAGADFGFADLADAHFEEADLHGANFTKAQITGTDFTRAQIKGAIFTGVTGTPMHFKTREDFLKWAKSQGAIVGPD
jgi:hypothetical protein